MIEYKKVGIESVTMIQKIAYETWPNTFGRVLPSEQIAYMLDLIYNEISLRRQILEYGHNFILAEKDSAALGFASYEIDYKGRPQLMVHKIYILPSAQGLGIGSKFLDLLSDIALENNNKQLRLMVYFENTKAIGFYERHGFKNIGTEKTDIGNDYIIQDNVMVKELQLLKVKNN